MDNFVEITVENWEKYNPRSDRSNFSWFRFQNDFFSDQKVFNLSSKAKLLAVFILCMASKRNQNEKIILNIDFICFHTRINKKKIMSYFNEITFFKSSSRVSDQTTSDTLHNSTVHYRTEQNNTVQKTIAHKPVASPKARCKFDFEEIYKNYPRKIGKKKGMLSCKRVITTLEEYTKLMSAVNNYSAYCKANGRELKYVLYFSTFMGEWEDWVDVKSLAAPSAAPSRALGEALRKIAIGHIEELENSGDIVGD